MAVLRVALGFILLTGLLVLHVHQELTLIMVKVTVLPALLDHLLGHQTKDVRSVLPRLIPLTVSNAYLATKERFLLLERQNASCVVVDLFTIHPVLSPCVLHVLLEPSQTAPLDPMLVNLALPTNILSVASASASSADQATNLLRLKMGVNYAL